MALEEFGIPTKLIQLINECNNRTLCKVKFGNEMSQSFEVKTSFRQDDELSPVLFNLSLEKVVRTMSICLDMDILTNSTLLAYADDIVIMGNT